MNFKDFISNFKTIEQVIGQAPNSFPELLQLGFWVKNDEKCRVEFIAGGVVAAWIDYSLLMNEPEVTFKMFVRRVYGTDLQEELTKSILKELGCLK